MNQVSDTARPQKPKIGLALGGGVARGWAHIGVVRAMTKAGIEPDIIAGTSMGALVGGAYLTDNLDVLEHWARGLTGRRILSYLDLTFGGSGFIGGARLKKLMDKYFGDTTFEELDRRFIAVTAELATAHEIWIRHGRLIDGIQASYALPGVFPPVMIDDRWLIDGALVNPVPVSVCRAFGARIVIAVGLHTDPFGKGNLDQGDAFEDDETGNGNGNGIASTLADAIKTNPKELIVKQLFGRGSKAPGVGSVMLGALNIVMDRLGRSRMAGDPPDVLVSPRVGHISLLDFNKADELITLGERAFEEARPQIEHALDILS